MRNLQMGSEKLKTTEGNLAERGGVEKSKVKIN